jgi:hypothetical protein
MKHASQPQAISWFRQHYIGGRLELRPPFQRKPVWSSKQRCSLIESILLDIPLPEIYVQVTQNEDGDTSYRVVDGQQRLRTILQFVGVEDAQDQTDDDHNQFMLDDLPANSVFLGKKFSDLNADQKKRFFSYEVCVRLLYTENVREVEDVFKRLNKFTLPLKPQELRNATYHSAFAKLAEALADDEYWAVNRIVTPASIRRMADVEFMSDLLIGLIHGPQGGSARILDQYYEMYEPNEDEIPGQAKLRHLFGETLLAIQTLFEDISNTDRWSNRADFYSLFVSLGSLLDKNELPKGAKLKSLRTALEKFAAEVSANLENPNSTASTTVRKYARAIEKGSNDKARRSVRHEVMLGLVKPFLRERQSVRVRP